MVGFLGMTAAAVLADGRRCKAVAAGIEEEGKKGE